MNEHPLYTYLMAQGELGGFEVVMPLLSEPLSEPRFTRFTDSPDLEKPTLEVKPKPVLEVAKKDDDSLWKNASSLGDFYGALRGHSVYTKGMRLLSFYAPEIKTDVPYLLVFHSPLELTVEARDILERLFKKLEINLNKCGVSFFLKCEDATLPREKNILKDMLCKEIELINPEKIIFFREAPKPEKIERPPPISGNVITFAEKPAITLYSLLEIFPSKPNVKEKMNEVLSICKAFTPPRS
ncbi:MAG: hypothetical protein FWF63_06575 [Fibromonadales bacterium]|nr:hypothetical protein [Fibromonadales bacterium]